MLLVYSSDKFTNRCSMPPIVTCRCPSCGVLNPIDQQMCNRCLGPLPSERASLPPVAMTDETCHLYQAATLSAMLLFSRTRLEYSAERVAFTTAWNNVAQVSRETTGWQLWLYQTPQQIRLPLGSSHTWFSDITRTVPLDQFGYPNNKALWQDLWNYAPQVRRTLQGMNKERG